MKRTARTKSAASADEVQAALRLRINEQKVAFFPRFFQAFPGGYAEGDRFLGITVPDQRTVARQFRDLPRNEIDQLLSNPFHECRLTAIFILVDQFKRKRDPVTRLQVRQEIVDYLLSRTDGINNWDLVDSCASQIVGEYVVERSKPQLLFRLAKSDNLWEQRLGVVANLALIKECEFEPILKISERLLEHHHDLIHKAVGWMLREMGKKNEPILRSFLDEHAHHMPRTMLRYAIEKLPEARRQHYLRKKS